MKRILVVCLGNICRSPLGEGILRKKLDSKKFYIDSAGTANYHRGDNPDSRSVEVAKKYGIDISNLKARQFTLLDFKNFDYILAMDKNNYSDILALASDDKDRQKVYLFMDWLYPGKNVEVPDPYYGGKDGFEKVFLMIDQASEKIRERLSIVS